MTLPFVIVEDESNISVCDSHEAIDRELEIIDVRNGVYRCYDASGRRLQLCVRHRQQLMTLWWPFAWLGDQYTTIDYVSVEEPLEDDTAPNELADLLRRHFKAADPDSRDGNTDEEQARVNAMQLPQLIERLTGNGRKA